MTFSEPTVLPEPITASVEIQVTVEDLQQLIGGVLQIPKDERQYCEQDNDVLSELPIEEPMRSKQLTALIAEALSFVVRSGLPPSYFGFAIKGPTSCRY